MTDTPTAPWYLRVWRALISPRLTVICLAFLIVLTFVGTVYQTDHGLHEAKLRFFDSWVAFLGVVPFPGTQLVMAVLLVNLSGYLLQVLARDHMPFGILLTHLGILLMLLGGLGLTFGLVVWMRRRDYRATRDEYDTHSLDE